MMNIAGKKYGRLTAIAPISSKSGIKWVCQCDCGNVVQVFQSNLLRGTSRSCGCFQKEGLAERNAARKTALGESNTRLYKVWKSMKRRCYGKNYDYYNSYGGRGVSVCEAWQNYITFRNWALAHGYDESAEKGKCTLDRIDVNGNYDPDNCRFITMKEQADNRRTTKHIEYNGEIHNIKEWSDIYSIPSNVLAYRVKAGWNFKDAISIPVKRVRRGK